MPLMVRELRLTRLAAAALAGAALATAGCVVQGLFRNAWPAHRLLVLVPVPY